MEIAIIGLIVISVFSWVGWYKCTAKIKELNNTLEHKEKSLSDTIEKNYKLEKELQEAKNLKNVLEILATKTGIPTPKYGNDSCLTIDYATGVSWSKINTNFNLPDNVLQYVDDILGGKVIKQEGNKCLVIAKDGTVKTGLTKAKVDKGYSYKLVRE